MRLPHLQGSDVTACRLRSSPVPTADPFMQDVSSPTPLANRARQVLVQQPELPLPGSGRTLQRWQALAAWGQRTSAWPKCWKRTMTRRRSSPN